MALPQFDYAAPGGVVSLADGVTNGTITIQILDDVLVEGNEAFIVTISNPTGGSVISGPSAVLVTIEEPHMYNVDDAVARVDSYIVSVTGGGSHVGEQRMVRIETVGRSAATAALLDSDGNVVEAGASAANGDSGEKLESSGSGGRRRRGSRGGRRRSRAGGS